MRSLIRFSLSLLVIFMVFSYSFANQEVLSVAQIAAKFGKAVVLITTTSAEKEGVGLGSGFIVDEKGVIITNYHVIAGAYPAAVKLTNGDIYDDISIIDYDERRDIAVIKIKGWGLPIVKLGNSEIVKVGEQIVVIGNPEGLENTVTDGLVSGIRDTGRGYKMHQISAPISSGSSGSPVFNRKGEVIGIATSSIIEGQNLNFSVPINYARGMTRESVKMSLEEFSRKDINKLPLKSKDIKPKTVYQIKERIIDLQNKGSLGFREFKLCSKIIGFASYVPLPKPILDKKGKLLVYYEPMNVFTRRENGFYEIWYTQDMVLLKSDGSVVREWKDILNFNYRSRKPALDLFAENSIPFEGRLPPGKYKFKAVLKDKISKKSATKIIEFEIR